MYTLSGFAVFFCVFWFGMWLVHLTAIFYGKYKLHRKVPLLPQEMPYPGVTIIKPLTGVDPNLYSNLETFFTMSYPKYEISFCIEEENDPAVPLVEKLCKKYPNIDTNVFIGGQMVGVNPKINNMQPGYKAAKYDLILISDSGIRMKEDTLLDMVNHMKSNVGLVHQMPFTWDRTGFPAALEKTYFGTAQARIYLAANFLQIPCHTGMSTLTRKEIFEEMGGLKAFGCYLAEDLFFAKAILERGWKVTISGQPAWQNSGYCDITSFKNRLSRWVKLRIAMVPFTLVCEPLSECLILGACASWAMSFLFQIDAAVFYLVHILVWFLLDAILISIVQNGSLPYSKFHFIISWLFRELLGPYVFFTAIWDPVIKWRTRSYKLRWGGIADEYNQYIEV